jgi:anti-sigma regulatory factor (Ser/Thr protein kinase)
LEDLSLHILDVAENSLRAGARWIRISIREVLEQDLLELTIEDDGKGMPPDLVRKVLDPFTTTKEDRRIGLGLPLLADAAREAGGEVTVESKPDKGTRIRATFRHGHIDRKPLGDVASTVVSLLVACPDLELEFEHRRGEEAFRFDTREVRREIHPIPVNHPEVLHWIRSTIRGGLSRIGAVDKETTHGGGSREG